MVYFLLYYVTKSINAKVCMFEWMFVKLYLLNGSTDLHVIGHRCRVVWKNRLATWSFYNKTERLDLYQDRHINQIFHIFLILDIINLNNHVYIRSSMWYRLFRNTSGTLSGVLYYFTPRVQCAIFFAAIVSQTNEGSNWWY